MTRLADWQQALVANILEKSAQADTPMGRAQALYANNLMHTQRQALATTYPVTAMMLGSEGFAKAAYDYLQLCPKTSFDWGEYGATFASFLAEQEGLAEHPVIAQMAQYEWVIAQANRADNISCDLASLALIQTEPHTEIALVVSPGLCFIRSDYDLPTLHQGHLTHDLDTSLFSHTESRAWLVHRPASTIQSWPIPADFLALSESLFAHSRSNPYIALSLVLQLCDEYDVDISAWLTTMVQANLILGARSLRSSDQ